MDATLTLYSVLVILLAHWISDFVLQSDDMAKGKYNSFKWLSLHVATYTVSMFVLILVFTFQINIYWILLNGVLHFATDYVTSKLNNYLWAQKRVHDFFVSVGFDQFVHYACLFGTLVLFY